MNTYEVIIVNQLTEERKEFVVLKEIDNSEKKILFETEDGEFNMTLYPELNCYNQDDPVLIRNIKEKILLASSTLGNYFI